MGFFSVSFDKPKHSGNLILLAKLLKASQTTVGFIIIWLQNEFATLLSSRTTTVELWKFPLRSVIARMTSYLGPCCTARFVLLWDMPPLDGGRANGWVLALWKWRKVILQAWAQGRIWVNEE